MNLQDTKTVEMALIYSIIHDNETLLQACSLVEPQLFHDQQNRQLFSYLKNLASTVGKVDQMAISYDLSLAGDELINRYMEVEIVGADITNPGWVNAVKYADALSLRSKRDRLLQSLSVATKMCESGSYKDTSDMYTQILSIFESDRSFIASGSSVAGPKELADDFFDRVASAGEVVASIPTGFNAIDACIGGLKPAKLIVIGGRPSMGKTSLALNIAEHVAFTEQKKVLFVSIEMSKAELIDRIACVHLKLDSQTMDRKAEWSDAIQSKVGTVCDKIRASQLFVSDDMKSDVDKLIAMIRLQNTIEGVDLVIIDYLQLISSSGFKNNKVNEVSDITRKLKLLSVEINKPVILLSQLNRGLESRSDKRPTMADLRDSGSIEQDADIIIFVNRNKSNEVEKREPDLDYNEARIVIDKHRGGPTTDRIVLGFRAEQTRFLNQLTK